MKIKAVAAIFLGLFSVMVFAQVRPGPRPGAGGPPPGGPNRVQPLDGVKAALSLSDTQVDAVRALLGVQMESMRPLLDTVGQKRRAYQEASSQANPDPTALANALTALRDAESALKAAHQKFELDFEALLTPIQLATLNSIREAAPKIQALAALGLLGGGPQGPGGFGRGGPGSPGPRGGGRR